MAFQRVGAIGKTFIFGGSMTGMSIQKSFIGLVIVRLPGCLITQDFTTVAIQRQERLLLKTRHTSSASTFISWARLKPRIAWSLSNQRQKNAYFIRVSPMMVSICCCVSRKAPLRRIAGIIGALTETALLSGFWTRPM